VAPIVFYNGEGRWRAACEMSELVHPVPGALARFRPVLPYLLIDEGRYADHPLPEARNLAAALIEWLKAPD
jgi:hypothetical protein